MSHVSLSKQDLKVTIAEKLQKLQIKDLQHINHCLDMLMDSSSMHYLGRFLGISECGEGFAMELGKPNENIYGVAQGGAIYTLADVAIGFFISSPLGKRCLPRS